MKYIYNSIFILFLIFLISGESLTAKNISIVFRYDDFTLTNDSINEKIINLFQKHNIPLVLGVIPFDSNDNKIIQKNFTLLTTLKKAVKNRSVEIALHGYNHTKVSSYGEFLNVPLGEQLRRINLGKQLLDSVFHQKTVTFIPPWNSYDENTLKAMKKSGLKVISSSLSVNQPYSNRYISYYPQTMGNPAELIPTLEQNINRPGIIVLMFHHYDFGKEFSLNDLDVLLSKIKNYNVNITTFNGLFSKNEVSSGKRFSANLEIDLLTKLLNMHGELYSTNRMFFVKILNLLLYLFITSYIFFLSFFYVKKTAKNNWMKLFFFTIVLILISSLDVWFHWMGPVKSLITFSIIALFGGYLLSAILNKTQKGDEA